MKKREKLAEPTKREVRQRCGFGCVMCGYPIITYHHLEEWAETQDDSPENLVLLCERCHREYHAGFIDEVDLRHRVGNPIAFEDATKERLRLNPKAWFVDLGSQRFGITDKSQLSAFSPFEIIDERPITIEIQDGFPLVSISLYGKGGIEALKIVRNEVIIDAGIYDVEWDANQIVVRLQKGLIVFKARFGQTIFIDEAVWVKNEHVVFVNGSMHYMNTMNSYSKVSINDIPVGIVIGRSQFCAFHDVPVFFEYPDVKQWVRQKEIPFTVQKLNLLVDYFGLPKSKTMADEYDKALFRKFFSSPHGVPKWMRDRGYSIEEA